MGATRQRALRKKGRQVAPTSAPTSSQGATSKFAKKPASSFDPASRAQLLQWDSPPQQIQTFTLNQEARSTHRSTWHAANRLRDNGITFVSGGNLGHESEEEDKPAVRSTEAAESSPVTEQKTEILATGEGDLMHQVRLGKEYEPLGLQDAEMDIPMNKEVCRAGESAADLDSSPARRRSPSASSSSLSEVILFAGRGNPQKRRKATPSPPVSRARTSSPVFNPKLSEKQSSPQPPPPPTPSRLKPDAKAFIPTENCIPVSGEPLGTHAVAQPWTWTERPRVQESQTGAQRKSRQPLLDSDEDEDGVLNDYIENMKANHELDEESSPAENGQFGRSTHQEAGRANGKPASKAEIELTGKKLKYDWTSDDFRDLDELDTSDDDMAQVSGVFSRRQRASGLQYLVSPPGQSADFVKWILKERLASSPETMALIQIFEDSHPDGPAESDEGDDHDYDNGWGDPSSDDSDEEALNDLIRDQDSEERENERILRQTSQMSDAELARLLNKQAELGIAGDDIVLFDGAIDQSQDYNPFLSPLPTSSRTRPKRSRRSKGTFPSAEAFAEVLDEDPYNGFDVMDFDRPSLKAKQKGRKSANGLPFELEDDELGDQLAQSWANDRAKKAVKKAEREELRQAGLLGAKARNGRVDLQSKYSIHGMSMDEVKAEVRMFLMDGEREALALAPMGSPQRAQVHMLAKALSLKSHSQGKGDTRFPILTKTDFSGSYDEHTIGQIDALLARKKFSTRWGKKDNWAPNGVVYKAGGKSRRHVAGGGGGGGGGVAAGASYMDGEVVGGSAPELGSDNRGRAMLEKMGWSSGMGIGKVGNKGSVEVIKHVVKNTKAGLG